MSEKQNCVVCNKSFVPSVPVPDGEGVLFFCSKICIRVWERENGLISCDIESLLPGGRYDGLLEESGLKIRKETKP